jgi:pimeloyl-ACP methyl ester carboxylesterase
MTVSERTHLASKILLIGRRKELEYYEFGAEDSDAHPILYHYGLPGSGYEASLAHGVAKQLGVRIIAPNRPGCGNSTFDPNRKLTDWADIIIRLADALRVDRATVVGVSSGGAYACALGHLCPQRVASIVLLSSLAPVAAPRVTLGMRSLNRLFCTLGWRFPQLTYLPLHVLAMRYHYDPSGFQRQFASSLIGSDRAILDKPDVAAAFDRAMEETLRQGPRGLAHDINIVAGPWADLEEITCPVRIIHGDQDGIAPLAMAQHLRGRLPHATLEVVPARATCSPRMWRASCASSSNAFSRRTGRDMVRLRCHAPVDNPTMRATTRPCFPRPEQYNEDWICRMTDRRATRFRRGAQRQVSRRGRIPSRCSTTSAFFVFAGGSA